LSKTTRSIVIGAVCAVVVVAAGVGALVMRGGAKGGVPSGAATTPPSKVVVVFAMAGEDNAVTAQLVATVDSATGRYELTESSTTVSIPGTSYTALRDAYPFGGAEAVAAALAAGKVTAGTAWVDVSPQAWEGLLAQGFDTTMTEAFDTFDDLTDHYSEFVVGPQHVAVEDLRGLVNGLPYLGAEARLSAMADLAAASMRALKAARPVAGIETDLTAEQWTAFTRALGGG
jgi:hypothetical protein